MNAVSRQFLGLSPDQQLAVLQIMEALGDGTVKLRDYKEDSWKGTDIQACVDEAFMENSNHRIDEDWLDAPSEVEGRCNADAVGDRGGVLDQILSALLNMVQSQTSR